MKIWQFMMALLACFALSVPAFAAPIVPAYTTFGPLPSATFGGSGIPNDRVAVTTVALGSGTLTMGLTVTERYDNPAVGDDGAGVFFVAPGPDTNSVSPNPAYAKANFDFFVQNTSTADFLNYALYYDFDPAVGNDQSTLGVLNLSSGAFGLENSYNQGMLFLNADVPGFVTAPMFPAFNPNAQGQYSFALVATNLQGVEVGRSAILVNVGEVPVPEPASMVLLGLGFIGGAMRRYKRRQ